MKRVETVGGTKYVYFQKDDLVKVSADGGNGWWYGHVVESFDEMQDESIEQGFFPSNYVTTLKSGDQDEIERQQKLTEQAGIVVILIKDH